MLTRPAVLTCFARSITVSLRKSNHIDNDLRFVVNTIHILFSVQPKIFPDPICMIPKILRGPIGIIPVIYTRAWDPNRMRRIYYTLYNVCIRNIHDI